MARFMTPESALERVVDDENAPVMLRCDALRQLAHPPLLLLRRLLVNTAKRNKPVPSRLFAIAALAYAREVELKKIRIKRKSDEQPRNALGV